MRKTSTSCNINTLERAISCQSPNLYNYDNIEHFNQNVNKDDNIKKSNNKLPIAKPIEIIEYSNENSSKSNKNSSKSRDIKNLNNKQEVKIKYVETKFNDFVPYGNKLGQNYNMDPDNELRFSESTRRKSYDKSTQSLIKQKSRDPSFDYINLDRSTDEIDRLKLLSADSELRIPSNIMSINSNEISNNAAKVQPKELEEYWDNTKRRNLDTSVYTNNSNKSGGRGFGDISSYGLMLNNIGTPTRQDNPDTKPRNIDNDRIFITNHNNNNSRYHVTENLQCGADTRYLNKKMI